MTTVCKWAVRILAVLYLAALALFLIGTLGLFGQERDPLSAVFLMPLGLPWVLLLEGVSDNLKPWLAVIAPALNIAVLAAVCRFISPSRGENA